MIKLPTSLEQLVKNTREKNQKLVLVTGVFDILHKEHQNFLKTAKRIGDVLIVGLETDGRVKEIKGVNRPINSQLVRKTNLENWGIADAVFILPADFHLTHRREELIKLLRPKILAVSSHTAHLEDKANIMGRVGGRVQVIYQHNPAVSTTQLINQQNE